MAMRSLLTDFNDDIQDPKVTQFFGTMGLEAIHLAVHRSWAPFTKEAGDQ